MRIFYNGLELGRLRYGTRTNSMTLEYDGRHVAVSSQDEASSKFRQFVEAHGLGASDVDDAFIWEDGRKVAKISYNGRIWPIDGGRKLGAD